MRDHFEVTATNSTVAVGRGNIVHGGAVPPAVSSLRAQLDRVRHRLADLPSSEVGIRATIRLADLQEVVDETPTDGPEIRRRWDRLRTALAAVAALGVTGATAFSADIAQIAGTIASGW